jgi:hypothetical protein
MADYISPEQWGAGTSLSYVPSSSWFLPSYQSYLPGVVPEGQAYSGQYLAPTSWLNPAYQNYVSQYTVPTTETNAINFPTAEEAAQWAYGQPGFQQQSNILSSMSTQQGFQQMLQPYINQMMTSLGRSGMPSSSYADRMIADTLGNAYAQNALNVASGWGNYMEQVSPWAAGYAQYPLNIAGLLQG